MGRGPHGPKRKSTAGVGCRSAASDPGGAQTVALPVSLLYVRFGHQTQAQSKARDFTGGGGGGGR